MVRLLSGLLVGVIWISLFHPSRLYAFSLTGTVGQDFPEVSCFDDPSGQNIPMPPSFPDGSASGFDVSRICLFYSGPVDTLFVGVQTFTDGITGLPVIFGDADGDGDPSNTSSYLDGEGGIDFPDLGDEEFFGLVFDFDSNFFGTPPNVIAGISISQKAPTGYRVSEVALPHRSWDFAMMESYYGPTVSTSHQSTLFASPTASAPHLEFNLRKASLLPGFDDLDLLDPDETIGLIFKAGSLGDVGIGEEDVRATILLDTFVDGDGDDLPNVSDTDRDNDGIPDLAERSLDDFDLDGNCLLSSEEITQSGKDLDGDGDIDIHDGFANVDTDKDGLPDYLDTDSDNDLILDLDGNNSISPAESAGMDMGGNLFGGDDSGCVHNKELPDTDGDGIPDYRDTDSDADTIPDEDEAGDDDLETSPIDTDSDGIPDFQDDDTDSDGVADADEVVNGTDPTEPDSDGDGIPDGQDTGGEEGEGSPAGEPGDDSGGEPAGEADDPWSRIQVQGAGCQLLRGEGSSPGGSL